MGRDGVGQWTNGTGTDLLTLEGPVPGGGVLGLWTGRLSGLEKVSL